MKKRIGLLLMAVLMMLSIASCGKKDAEGAAGEAVATGAAGTAGVREAGSHTAVSS